ncbi:sucrose-6-phosphate hydrolase [Vibrio sp. JC009]|uniref:glycoside hydrolase family 32 protein n=1 Tax=Vibrio sp. JC009 TaxID=2912314 RepID=UPI0023B05022|nr:sucrose-6-phosphate hydrolase [Vibrio sp. JC009]WED24295.1 sucrose-6-phosphate hydrolase [Vibrio sp. JC009]
MTSLLKQADSVLLQADQEPRNHLRPKFHLAAPKGLLNDPNGFIEFDGQYHLFFQWNPFACEHGAKFWGHSVSNDLVHWELKPTALAPDADYDTHGCYSGSAFELDGELHLLYTGNKKAEDGERFSTQCLVKATDSTNEKYHKIGPVIHTHPEGYTAHFRDPKIWQHEGNWYCVLGGQTTDELGQVLLYSSPDAYNWKFEGPIAGNNINGLTEFGYMFECPDLFAIGDTDILIGCPQGIGPHGTQFQNLHNNGYFTGSFDYQNMSYQHGEFRPLDQGFEFYAPQTTDDSKGRRLLSAWVGIPDEDNQPTLEQGWIHMLSLVRELSVEKGKVVQKPFSEHVELRRSESKLEAFKLDKQSGYVAESENCFELNLTAESIKDGFTLKLADEGDRFISLSYEPESGRLVLDRTNSGYLAGTRECTLPKSDKLDLQIFFDYSIIEIFVNGGEEVFTSRVFPSKSSSKLALSSESSCIISRFEKYDY